MCWRCPLAPIRRHLVDLVMKRPGADTGAAVAADEDPLVVRSSERWNACVSRFEGEAGSRHGGRDDRNWTVLFQLSAR